MTRMRAGRGSVWVVTLVAIGVFAPGCNQGKAGTQEVRLIASSRPYEPDVPIPVGFKLVDEASEDRSTGVARLYMRHLYRGRADKHAVRGFYRDQMPLARWVRVSDGNVQGKITMRFEKGNESCTIGIQESDGRFSTWAEVQVLVSQEQRGSGDRNQARRRNQT